MKSNRDKEIFQFVTGEPVWRRNMEKTNTFVPFVASEIKLCICTRCPVQAASGCIKAKAAGIQGALKRDPLQRADIPGLYCATGTATCSDLNSEKNCICGTCVVFSIHTLGNGKPAGYYCRDGSSR